MSANKKILFYLLFCILGIIIFTLTLIFEVDTFWNGIAVGFIFTSALKLFALFKYKNDSDYAKKVTIQNKDERNIFLANKAKSIAFYFYIIISAIAVIILRIFELNQESQFCAYSVCLLLILYYIAYTYVRKKY